jgi:hypothetical protein
MTSSNYSVYNTRTQPCRRYTSTLDYLTTRVSYYIQKVVP